MRAIPAILLSGGLWGRLVVVVENSGARVHENQLQVLGIRRMALALHSRNSKLAGESQTGRVDRSGRVDISIDVEHKLGVRLVDTDVSAVLDRETAGGYVDLVDVEGSWRAE